MTEGFGGGWNEACSDRLKGSAAGNGNARSMITAPAAIAAMSALRKPFSKRPTGSGAAR